MMRKLFYIFFFFSLFTIRAQYDTAYYRVYGGVNFDEARDVKETYDKGYIIAGTSSSFGPGDASVYLIKTDSMGNHLWSSTYGGTQNDWAYSINITPDSGYFVAGYSNSFGLSQQSGYDAYYFKTDKNGNLQWQKSVIGSDWDFIYSSWPMPDSGFVLCGETFTNSNGGSDAYMIRLNKAGDTLWTRHFGGSLDEKFLDVCVINNNIYAVGKKYTNVNDSLSYGWIIQIDPSGNVVKEHFLDMPYNLKNETALTGISPYGTSQFFVSGTHIAHDSSATVGLIGLYNTAAFDSVYLDVIGQVNKDYYIELNNIIQVSNGKTCAVGQASGAIGKKDIYTVSMEADHGWWIGSFRLSGGSEDDYAYGALLSTGGKLIVVGSSQNYCSGSSGLAGVGHPNPSIDNVPGMGVEDVFLLRFNRSDSLELTTIPNETCFADTLSLWQVVIKNYSRNFKAGLFPNPVDYRGHLEIRSDASPEYKIKVYSSIGTEVMNFTTANNSTEIDFSSLEEGSYTLKIEGEQSGASYIKFIVIR